MRLYQSIGDRKREGSAVGNMGVAYDALFCPTEALDCYQQHLAIAHEIADLNGKRASILTDFPVQPLKNLFA